MAWLRVIGDANLRLVGVDNASLVEMLVPAVLIAVAVTTAFWLVRTSRAAWRATGRDMLEIVLAPSLAAEHSEIELTSMLLSGELSAVHYSSLLGALAQQESSISPPGPSVETGRSPAS